MKLDLGSIVALGIVLAAGAGFRAGAAAMANERPKEDAGFAREGDAARRKIVDALEWKAPPKLATERWVNGEATTFEKLKGRVVLIDFWGTW